MEETLSFEKKVQRITAIRKSIDERLVDHKCYGEALSYARANIDPTNPPTLAEFWEDWNLHQLLRISMSLCDEKYRTALLEDFIPPENPAHASTLGVCGLSANEVVQKHLYKASDTEC